jgi:RNA polymerase sigma-70 factor, ECF subfamily
MAGLHQTRRAASRARVEKNPNLCIGFSLHYAHTMDIDPDLRDPGAFERAYREHRPRAFAAALGVLRDPVAAEDVVQDVFAELWRRPGAFDGERGLLRSYVTMLARSRAVDRKRSLWARHAALERLAAAADRAAYEGSAAERAIARERSAGVVTILDRLPAAQREALLLAYGRELTAGEIAQAVGVPLGTAKGRIRLGLEKMRESAEHAR